MTKKNLDPLIIKGNLNKAEIVKKNSNHLRGSIIKDLNNDLTGAFTNENISLIRFHGMYQQDDRDIRYERIKQKLEPRYAMMLRCRLPGGMITSNQWLAIHNFTQNYSLYKSIRLTNRQTIQIHGILKHHLKSAHRMLFKVGLDAFATANDANRNVLCTANPLIDFELYEKICNLAKKISDHFLPQTNAYAEIWWDKPKVQIDQEPILGNTYLPRKFKIAIAIPPYNDVDLHANDLNFIAISKDNKLIGFNLLIGGGLSIQYGNKDTYPNTATEIGYIKANQIIDVSTAVITIQRDWGNRINRANAKTRYTLERVGIEKFKNEIEIRASIKFKNIQPYKFISRSDYYGWLKDAHSRWNLSIFIENGRIIDNEKFLLKTAIAEIAKIHQGLLILTANQNLIIRNILSDKKKDIEYILSKYNIMNNISMQRYNSMACVSFPTCPLAIAEAERILPYFISKLELIMEKYGLSQEHIVLRITGCPNGCGRVMLAEIGLVGRAIGRYNLYIGGNSIGTRIPKIYKENLTEEEILISIDKLIKYWAENRNFNESFGDFVIRVGIIKPIINSNKDFWN